MARQQVEYHILLDNLPRSILEMRPEKRWAPIKDQFRSVIKDKPADPAEINFWRGSAEQGVACCRIKNPKHGQEAFEKMQGYLWKERRLRAWLLEKDPADSKMYYLGGPQNPLTGKEEPVPVNGPVPLSPRLARRDHLTQRASISTAVPNPQTPPQSMSRGKPIASPASTGRRQDPSHIAQSVLTPGQILPGSIQNPAYAPDIASYTVYPYGYQTPYEQIPSTSSNIRRPQQKSENPGTSDSSSAYLLPDVVGYVTAPSDRRTPGTSYTSHHNSTSGSSTSSSTPHHRIGHYSSSMASLSTTRRPPFDNPGPNKVTVQHLDGKNNANELRLFLERQMNFSSGDFGIKLGKGSKGKHHAFITFRTAKQAEHAVTKLAGARIGHNKINAVLEKQAQYTGRSTRSGSNDGNPSGGGVISRQERTGDPIIIDGSVSD